MENQAAGGLSLFFLCNKVCVTLDKEEFDFLNMFYIPSATDMFCLW